MGQTGQASPPPWLGPPSEATTQADVQQEISRMGITLDAKANDALEEVGPAAALSIVRTLGMQGSKVQNPSAYIMRAAANERNESMAKRARLG
mmetsp:Transcript_124775/g.349525  ORF Transcript_124775/g.349525 Transcript_124775/m.349525 type:complete len:93 (-) Transcript_124775:76-354(-)